ncbi:MAG: ferritin-like domain-containing protein [Pseudomonadota bacterium]
MDGELPPYRALANSVLNAAAPTEKCQAARAFGKFFSSETTVAAKPELKTSALLEDASGDLDDASFGAEGLPPPQRPARPKYPELRPPAAVPRRRIGTKTGRIALLHAVAHIELNAIDLAFDMVSRFTDDVRAAGLNPVDFIRDWVEVGVDEARHFQMIETRLQEMGASYGALPAHDGLWQAAEDTSDSVLARLAIAPMVLEARGLDVTPSMIEKLRSVADKTSADCLEVIYTEEIDHVRKGVKWFNALCAQKAVEPSQEFSDLVRSRFNGALKPPFNDEARTQAGLLKTYYMAFDLA